MLHITGSLWKQTPFSRALLNLSFRVSSKGALPAGSLYRAPTDRDASLPKFSFIHLSKSLVNEPQFQVPQRGPFGDRCPPLEPLHVVV